MKSQLSTTLDSVQFAISLLIAGLTPIIFTNLTTEFYETPKLIFLALGVILSIGLMLVSWIVKGKISIQKTPLDFPLILLAITVLASTFFTVSRYPAIFGNLTRVHGTTISYITYVLLFFSFVPTLRTRDRISKLLYVLLGSGLIVALLSLLSYFKVYLPFDFAKFANFSVTGSSFSSTALLMLLLPLPLLSIIRPNKFLPLPLSVALSTLYSITIILLGTIPSYILLMGVYIISIFIGNPTRAAKQLPVLLIPLVTTVLSLILIYTPFAGNPLQQLSANFPREIQLPLGISWKITASAFRDAPFFGTGPATYYFNFTSYKPYEFNLLKYWNFSFDNAQNELFQVLATLGVSGIISLLLISFVILRLAIKVLSKRETEEHSADDFSILTSGLALGSVLAVLLFGIHSTTLVSFFVSLVIFAAFLMSQPAIRDRVSELSIGIKAATGDKQTDLFPLIVFVVFLVLTVPGLYKGVSIVMADFYHRQAIVSASVSANDTYQFLQKAESLNPYIDLYRVDIAQTNFGLANAIALQKGPSQANPAGSLTNEDKQTIQTLLSQAITEGRVSVALSPLSSRNWELLGSIYRNMSGVANNALAFSLDAYGRAIQRDPVNPILRVNVGGIYYSAKNYDMSTRFFSDAINLKPDYVNAYYNLAITLRDKGDLSSAQQIAQQAVSLLQTDINSPDYKTASALLEDLKAKNAATAKDQTQAPAGQSNSALVNPDLPEIDVNELNNPPEPATPAAVRNPGIVLPGSGE